MCSRSIHILYDSNWISMRQGDSLTVLLMTSTSVSGDSYIQIIVSKQIVLLLTEFRAFSIAFLTICALSSPIPSCLPTTFRKFSHIAANILTYYPWCPAHQIECQTKLMVKLYTPSGRFLSCWPCRKKAKGTVSPAWTPALPSSQRKKDISMFPFSSLFLSSNK